MAGTLPYQMPPAEEKERKVQAMFTAIAHRYDLNNNLLSLGRHHAWKRKAVELANLKKDMTVLDLCAGTADIAILLGRDLNAKRFDPGSNGPGEKTANPGGRIFAVDLNERMLEVGRFKVTRQGLQGRVICMRGNAQWLPFKQHQFDRVTVAFGIRNVDDLERAFREILRVLKPGGRMICLEFSRPPNGLLRALYDFYSFRVLPIIGTLVSGDRTGVYQYLPASIRNFPDQEDLKRVIQVAGFNGVEYHNLSGGIVAIHVARS